MRSAANLTLRNNRSFVPLCRVEKGCIGLQVLDGDSEMYLTGNTLQYLYQVQSTGKQAGMECVERWCSTLHNACSAVEECRGSKSVCRSVQRQRGVRDCLYNFQQRFPAAGPTPYSTAPSSLDLAAAALSLHCAVAHFPMRWCMYCVSSYTWPASPGEGSKQG